MNKYSPTSDLSFRPLTLEMGDLIFANISGNVRTYFFDFTSRAECKEWIEKALTEISRGEKIEYAVFDKDRFVGLISLRDLHTSTPEFGLWIAEKEQHKGYGTASVQWLIAWAKKYTQASALIYDADSKNQASVHLAQTCGLTFEKEYQDGDTLYARYLYHLKPVQ